MAALKIGSRWPLLTMALLASAGGIAGAQQAVQARSASTTPTAIALQANRCQELSAGETFSVEWNPDFSHAEAVTGIAFVRLYFQPLDADKATVVRGLPIAIHAHGPQVTSLGNGIYRVVARVPYRQPAGSYRLTKAVALAERSDEARDPLPIPQNSPAGDGYCITVTSDSTLPAAMQSRLKSGLRSGTTEESANR